MCLFYSVPPASKNLPDPFQSSIVRQVIITAEEAVDREYLHRIVLQESEEKEQTRKVAAVSCGARLSTIRGLQKLN